MIAIGTKAPAFTLTDHFGRQVRLEQFLGKQHVMLLFYPLDFTPTWSREVPALEALLPRFFAAHTQPVGISVDSIYCHNNWANGLGGISLPLLADFHPKGAVAQSYGLYLEGAGITDRATVIMDTSGTVRHVSSVTPGGERDIAALAALCEGVDREWPTTLPAIGKGPGLEPGTVLYVKSRCMFSTNALSARHNLHLDDVLPVRNVTEDPSAMADLARLGGKTQAPCLVIGGKALYESADIQKYLAARVVGW